MNLQLELDKESRIPFYIQLEEQIRLMIQHGVFQPGKPLPTVRYLAVELGVNYNTVARVYRDLQEAGVLKLRRGIGTFVAEDSPTHPVASQDLAVIENVAEQLIALGKKADMDAAQITQLIEMKWKEVH